MTVLDQLSRGTRLRMSVRSRLRVSEFQQGTNNSVTPTPGSYAGELCSIGKLHYAIGKLLYKPRGGVGLWVYQGSNLGDVSGLDLFYIVVDPDHRIYAVPKDEVGDA